MMTTRIALVTLLCCIAATTARAQIVPGSQTSGAHGQAFVQIDPVGTPIAIVEIELVPGTWYEIQTFDLQPLPPVHATPDTIMTIRDGAGVDAITLAGADLCETPGAEPDERQSCVRFFADPARYPTPTTFYLWIRAQVTAQRGTTDVRFQRLLGQYDAPVDAPCTQPNQFRCWELRVNDRPFGGLTIRSGTGSSGLLHLETTALPAMEEHESMIVIVPGSLDDPTRNWQIASSPRGGPGSHRTGVKGAAEWVGLGSDAGIVDDTAIFIASTTNSFAAPIRLMRNDRVLHNINGANFTAGVDFDRDGLGADLEHVLRTCDSSTTPTFGDMPCVERSGCSADPDSAVCKAALRDSDGDALRDDHELYGVAVDGSSRLTELPRFGADPARYDLFIELDRRANGCDFGVPPPMYTNDEFRDLALIWRSFEGFKNRDGSNGIFVHVDSGTVPADPYETSHGRWGGAGTAGVDATHEANMHVSRRFTFRHFFEQCGRAFTPFNRTVGLAGGPTTFVHELGHNGGLGHGGPLGFSGGMNYKPNHWSRINYLFGDYGHTLYGQTPPHPHFTEMTFSTGRLANRPIDPRNADEACPFGPGTDVSLVEPALTHLWGTPSTGIYPGCTSLDWNGDHRIAGPGEIVATPILEPDDEGRRVRQSYRGVTLNADTGGDLAVAGPLLYWLRLRADAAGERVLDVSINREIDCGECDVKNSPCWDPAGTDDALVLRDGNAVTAAAIGGRVDGDGQPIALVVYVGGDARLHYGYLRGTAPVWSGLGIIPGSHAVGGGPQSRIPDVAAFGDGFVIAYRAEGGRAVTQHARLSGPGVAWDPPVDVLDDISGTPLVPLGDSSPAIGVIELPGAGEQLAIAMADPIGSASAPAGNLTVRVRGAGRWSVITHAVATGTGVQGRPSFAQTHYGDTTFLAVAWLGTGTADNELFFRRISVSGAFDPTLIDGDDVHFYRDEGRVLKAPHAMPLYFDKRGPRSQWGLRAVFSDWLECDNTDFITCPAGGAVCADPSQGNDPDHVRITCQSANGRLAGTLEYLVPFADGIFAGRIYDFDERPALRHGFCRGLRRCNESYLDGICIPPEFVEVNDDNVRINDELCAPAPTYDDMTCDPVIDDRDGDGVRDEVDRCPDAAAAEFDFGLDGCPDDFDDIIGFGEDLIPRLRGYITLVILLPAISDQAASKMQAAIDHLIGNDGGAADNGMLDKLRAAEWVAAGSAGRHVVRALIDAGAAGFDTKREQRDITDVYRASLALKLKKHELATGDVLRQAGDFEGAIIAYKDAAKRL